MPLNQSPLTEIHFNNFGGGYAGAKGTSARQPNEAQDLDNIIILPGGGGFNNRQGNSEVEDSNADLSGYINPVQGVISFQKATTEHLIWCTEIGTSGNVSVLEVDLAGSTHTVRKTVTGGDGQNVIFSMFKFKNLVIGVSDEQTTPFKIDMSGTPSGGDLGGTPPSGKVGIAWNNVAWIGNTSTNPSKLFYSVLNDAEDWSGAGSGFVEPQAGDGDELIQVVPVSNNVMLYFKRHSIHQVVGRADPFAVFPLVQGTGMAGKNAYVVADGIVHFITPEGKMRITDGSKIYDDKDIPALSNADDLWAQVPKTRLSYVQGVRHIGDDFDHLVFMVSLGASQTTNNYAIVWDFKNKCWLKHSKGWNGNCATTVNNGTVYIGGYLGRLYEQNVAAKYTDDSESTPEIDGADEQVIPTDPPAVSWLWRSDDLAVNSLQNIVQVDRANVIVEYQLSGNIKIAYGYDGVHDQDTKTISVEGGDSFVLGTSLLGGSDELGDNTRFRIRSIRPLGRGQTFNIKLFSSSPVATKLTKYTLAGRQQGRKFQEVR